MLNGYMPWGVLGLAPTGDTPAIRKAYAALIRQWRPDTHPLEFARVREAYELAMEHSRYYVDEEPGEAPVDEPSFVSEAVEAGAQAPEAVAPVPVPALQAGHGMAEQPTAGPQVHIPEGPVYAGTGNFPDADPLTGPPPAFTAAALARDLLLRAQGSGAEEAVAGWLRGHLRQCDGATIDDRMDYEWALLTGVLEDERPPLVLVFEAQRQLHWPERLDEVRRQFGHGAALRLSVLLDMADRYVFSTVYASNPWSRRLFAPAGKRVGWFAARSMLNEMPARAAQWEEWCATAGLPALMGLLNAAALRRIAGVAVMSTDVVLGLMVGWVIGFDGSSRPVAVSLGYLLAACGAVVALCVAWRWFTRLRWVQWVWKWRYLVSLQNARGIAIVIGFVVLVIGSIAAVASDAPWWVRAPGWAGLAGVFLFVAVCMATVFWGLLLLCETMLFRPVYRFLVETDLHAFKAMRESPGMPWQAPSFSERWRAVPAVWAARRTQKAYDKARAAEREKLGLQSASGFPLWLFLLGVVLVGNMVIRLTK